MGDYPITKVPSLFPGQWGISGSDSALGIRFDPSSRVFYVSSTHALANNANDGTDPNFPLATLNGAIGKAAVNDWVILADRHAETIATAGAITVNVTGLRVIGLGCGAARPTFTFNGLVGASILVTAAGFHMENVLCIGGLDGLTNPLHIQAADVTLKNIEWRDSLVTVEAARAILTTSAADRLIVDGLRYTGFAGGDACVNAIRLVGVDVGTIKNCIFQGNFSTSIIEFITTLSSYIVIDDCIFRNGIIATLLRNVVNTGGLACTWTMHDCYDSVAGKSIFGGSGVGGSGFRTDTGDYALEKTGALAPAGQANLFVIAGGPILVKEFYGYCTAAPGGATNCHIDETVIDPAADVPLSTDVAIDAVIAGGLIAFSVAAPAVLSIVAPGVQQAAPFNHWVLPPGTIKSHTSVARAAFRCNWYISYTPLSASSVVTVAP